MILSLAVILPLRIGSMAAATDSKILLKKKEKEQKQLTLKILKG
jgi:hypothetical protein